MKISKDLIIETAITIADQEGLSGVSLKKVAGALKISTPALYNHIDNLEELLLEIAHYGMSKMNEAMILSAVGVSGAEAVYGISEVYLSYLIAHPGIYETIQWACWHQTERTATLLKDYDSLLTKLLLSCDFKLNTPDAAVRMLKGFIHGYATQQLARAMQSPEEVKAEFSEALHIILAGLRSQCI